MSRKCGPRDTEVSHPEIPSCDSLSPELPSRERSAELIQITPDVRRHYRRAAEPGDKHDLSDPYEMVLLAQHERRLGRYVYANALIEEAFLTFDARAADDDCRVASLVRKGEPR